MCYLYTESGPSETSRLLPAVGRPLPLPDDPFVFFAGDGGETLILRVL